MNEESMNEEQNIPTPPSVGSVVFSQGTMFALTEGSSDHAVFSEAKYAWPRQFVVRI
jgi:hypothetical protein